MKTPQRHRRHRQPRADGGFVLLEAIVSIALITILMTALTALFVSSMKVTNHQRSSQSAIRIATDVIDQARGLGWDPPAVEGGVPTIDTDYLPASQQISGITYTITYDQSWCRLSDPTTGGDPVCAETDTAAGALGLYLRLGVTIRWPGADCQAGTCKYSTSVIMNTDSDPYFAGPDAPADNPSDPGGGDSSGDLSLTSPGNQRTALGLAGNVPLVYKCTDNPCSFTATGLPAGLAISNSGVISGTATTAGVYSNVSITLKDATNSITRTFTWYVLQFKNLALSLEGSGNCSIAKDLHESVEGASGSTLSFNVDASRVTDGKTTASVTDWTLTVKGNCSNATGTKSLIVSVTDSGGGAPAVTASGPVTVTVSKS